MIAGRARENSDGLYNFRWSVKPVLPSTSALDRKFGMDTPLPVNHQRDLADASIEVDNDLLDDGSKDTFLQSDIGPRVVPDAFEIPRQCPKRLG